MNYIDKIYRIIKEEGFTSLNKQVFDIAKVLYLKKFTREKEAFENWSRLSNIFEGKRAFLIGNGPSLNQTPLYLLKNEVTIGFNRFNLFFERLNWLPTIYTTVDERVAEDTADELNEISNNIKYCFFPDIHPRGTDFRKFIKKNNNIYWLNLKRSNFYNVLPTCGLNGTVANVGLQILVHLGIKKIYFIGTDMNYNDQDSVKFENKRDWTATSDDDPNHFDPRYFGVGKKYHRPRIKDLVLPGYIKAKKFTDEIGVEVYNATVGGKLEVFPRANFNDLFNYSDSEKKNLLFGDLIDRIDLTEARSIEENNISIDDLLNEKLLVCDSELGPTLIQKLIFSHIPYGPIDQYYYFVKR